MAAEWALIKYFADGRGVVQWNRTNDNVVVLQRNASGKNIADVIIENGPLFHVGGWKGWDDEGTNIIEELPWEGQDMGLGMMRASRILLTNDLRRWGTVGMLLDHVTVRRRNLETEYRVVCQYEGCEFVGFPEKGTLSYVSLYGWIRGNMGCSRWVKVEKWFGSDGMRVSEQFIRENETGIDIMWEYNGTNTSPSLVAYYDADRKIAVEWIDGRLVYVMAGSTGVNEIMCVRIDFTDKGYPKEASIRLNAKANVMSWVMSNPKEIATRTQDDLCPGHSWDKLKQDRMSFQRTSGANGQPRGGP